MKIHRMGPGRRQPQLRCGILAVISLAAASCGTGANDTEYVRKIPGTERMAAATGSMYVSPDERWMTYFTVISESSSIDGLVSIELGTGRRVEHYLDQVPGDGIGPQPYEDVIAALGRRVGWYNGLLYLPILTGGGNRALVVDNNQTAITLGRIPDDPLMLSDGPSWGTWRQEVNRRLGEGRRISDLTRVNLYSSAWRGGRYSEVTYWHDRRSDALVVGYPGRKEERVSNLPSGGLFTKAALTTLRVSPNESYLAYVVWHHSRHIPLPGMRDDVHVVDLASDRDRVVCSFRMVGNMQWSPDGKRLYLTGDNFGDSRGVYIVDVVKAFD